MFSPKAADLDQSTAKKKGGKFNMFGGFLSNKNSSKGNSKRSSKNIDEVELQITSNSFANAPQPVMQKRSEEQSWMMELATRTALICVQSWGLLAMVKMLIRLKGMASRKW